MVSIEETHIILDELAQELPEEFYNKLNGGILLLPDIKLHPENKSNDLYVMGEYRYSGTMGRYIVIYYGSFKMVHGHLGKDAFREKLKSTLLHEFTHHMESLAGERELEIKDAKEMEKYKYKHDN